MHKHAIQYGEQIKSNLVQQHAHDAGNASDICLNLPIKIYNGVNKFMTWYSTSGTEISNSIESFTYYKNKTC